MQRFFLPAIFLACLVLVFFVYLPGTAGSFMFDDAINISQNSSIRISSLDFLSLKQAALSGDAGALKRPIAVLSFALNYYLSGLNPFYFKLTNIAIHLLNGVCIFILSYLLLDVHRRRDQVSQLSSRFTQWTALAIAAAWLLHPLNLTGVLYVVQRMASLATLFMLLGLICYVYGRRRTQENKSGWGWINAALLVFTPLAMLSKENGALLPPLLLLTEVVFFRFQDPSFLTRRFLLGFFATCAALLVVGLTFYTLTYPGWLMGGYTLREFSLTERLMTEARIVWFYIRWSFIPDITQLGVFHDDIPLSKSLLQPPSTLFACLGILLLAALALASIKRHPIAAFAILFFLVGHSMESTFLALEVVHEHRNYMPLYGLLFGLFYYLLYPLCHLQSLNGRRAIAGIFIILLATVTYLRASQWSNPWLMKEMEVQRHPESIRANIDVASMYAAAPTMTQADTDELYKQAMTHYEKANSLSSSNTLGYFGMIGLHARYGLAVPEKWVNELTTRIEHKPLSASASQALISLEKCLSLKYCTLPTVQFEPLMQAALSNTTLLGQPRAAVMFARSSFLFNVKNQRDEAVAVAYQALKAYPQDRDNHITLIQFLINMDKLQEAQTHIDKTRQLDKDRIQEKTLNELQALVTQRLMPQKPVLETSRP